MLQVVGDAALGGHGQRILAGHFGTGLHVVLAACTGDLHVDFPEQPRLVDAVERSHLQIEPQRALRAAAKAEHQASLPDAADAGQPEARGGQLAGQRKLLRRAAERELSGQAAVHAVGRKLRGLDVGAQAIAVLSEGPTHGQAIRPRDQLHVGARNARPVDDEVSAPAQRLAGEPAVAQRELRLDDGSRLQAAAGGQGAVEQGCRDPGEAAWIEAQQFAACRKGHVPARLQFAPGAHQGVTSGQFEARQLDSPVGVAGFGTHREALIGETEIDALLRDAEQGRNRSVKAGRPQHAGQLRGVERLCRELQAQALIMPATRAFQVPPSRQAGHDVADMGTLVGPGKSAMQLLQRQALPVERTRQRVAQLELARDCPALPFIRLKIGLQLQAGGRRAGKPGRRIDVGQCQPRLGEGMAGKWREHCLPAAANALLRGDIELDPFERPGSTE